MNAAMIEITPISATAEMSERIAVAITTLRWGRTAQTKSSRIVDPARPGRAPTPVSTPLLTEP